MREHRRLSQQELARRMGTSRQMVSTWENGRQLPSLLSLEFLAQAADLELVIGLREPDAPQGEFLVLGVTEDERNVTELRLLRDYGSGTDWVPPTPWRRRIEDEFRPFYLEWRG
ncbi:MAG: helix-turn-helix transcriptional regulator [Actinomycetota bacterium]